MRLNRLVTDLFSIYCLLVYTYYEHIVLFSDVLQGEKKYGQAGRLLDA